MTEEQHYEAVLQEVKDFPRREGLWAKSLGLCDGNEDRAKHCYIKLRVEQRMAEDKQRDVESRRHASLEKWNDVYRWIKLAAPILFIVGAIILISIFQSSAMLHGSEFTADFVSHSIARIFANCCWAMCLIMFFVMFSSKRDIYWRNFIVIFGIIEFVHAFILLTNAPESWHSQIAMATPAIKTSAAIGQDAPSGSKIPSWTGKDIENAAKSLGYSYSPWTRFGKQIINIPSNIANDIINDIGCISLNPQDRKTSPQIPQVIDLPPTL